ncbi:hypothetical protein MM300_01875 [Evansella sp. LMS18]|uniref:hypothetical protein n=1 Tax=Evansella sp. LMS18 TaxID=2924033 RepID=UPI0020D0D4EE|nr:hypothetical protein [Evansella sp. LMS18]UTR11105.1 hypothetical protein MM300_01875 [Evansella sp. LMS18]
MGDRYKQLIKNKEDKINQLNQKVLHYHSELTKYKRELSRLSRKYNSKTEPERGMDQGTAFSELEKKVSPVLSYFSSAVFLEKETEFDRTIDIIGHFTFQNLTDRSIRDPVICLRVKPVSKVFIGGKVTSHNNINDKISELKEEWVYIQKEWVKERGEHWLKPLHLKELKPMEKGRFKNFNISMELTEEFSHYLVEGFFYSRNHQAGIPAVNSISIYI